MQLDFRHSLGPLCGAVTLAAVVAASALHADFGQKTADAAGGETVTPVFAYHLPNLPGQKMTGHLVEYAPGGSSPPHHHSTKASVVAYVLEGAIRSQVNDGPIRVYEAGESWFEPPGSAHPVSTINSRSRGGIGPAGPASASAALGAGIEPDAIRTERYGY